MSAIDYQVAEIDSCDELLRRLPEFRPEEHWIVVNARQGTDTEFIRRVENARCGIFDFDGTLHAASQWRDMRGLMSDENEQKDLEAVRAYFSGGDRMDEDDIRFIFGSVERLVNSGVARKWIIEKAADSPPREGACELIRSFEPGHTCVVSFGLFQYIRYWLEAHDLADADVSVAALKLKYTKGDSARIVSGCEPLTVVTDGNKGYMADTFRASVDCPNGNTLVMGDAITDVKMMHPENTAVLVVPQYDPERMRKKSRKDDLDRLWPRVSAVLVSDSLRPLADIRS